MEIQKLREANDLQERIKVLDNLYRTIVADATRQAPQLIIDHHDRLFILKQIKDRSIDLTIQFEKL